MENLPLDIQRYILEFLFSFENVVFADNYISNADDINTNYNPKYKIAFYGRGRFFNGKYLLSRIEKPNGIHRYYFTREENSVSCDSCNRNYTLNGRFLPNALEYDSSYGVGVSLTSCIKSHCSNRWCDGNMIIDSKYSSFYVGNEKNILKVFITFLFL